MRADRLVAALLVLQRRTHVTAADLAAELEVSVRTARRDLEALQMAGVPIYSTAGRGGGWSLVGGARTDLTGLNESEARALFAVLGSRRAGAPALASALRKLDQALPATFREQAATAAGSVVVDPSTWGRRPVDVPRLLAVVQDAIVDGVQIRLDYVDRMGQASTRVVHPLGVVDKGGRWYLVAGTEAGQRTFRIDRMAQAVVTTDVLERPDGFDLATEWGRVVEAVEAERASTVATVLAPIELLSTLRMVFARDLRVVGEVEPVDDHIEGVRVRVEIGAGDVLELAWQLAGWGDDIEVTAPDELRDILGSIGAALVRRYGGSGARGQATG